MALSPKDFTTTTEDDNRVVNVIINLLNDQLEKQNPDIKANPKVYLDAPQGWTTARKAVQQAILDAFRQVGWDVEMHYDQRDGTSIVLTYLELE